MAHVLMRSAPLALRPLIQIKQRVAACGYRARRCRGGALVAAFFVRYRRRQ